MQEVLEDENRRIVTLVCIFQCIYEYLGNWKIRVLHPTGAFRAFKELHVAGLEQITLSSFARVSPVARDQANIQRQPPRFSFSAPQIAPHIELHQLPSHSAY